MQFKSFLFEENLSDKVRVEMEIKKAVKEANSYKCGVCKHGESCHVGRFSRRRSRF
jgi:hypothetical protein